MTDHKLHGLHELGLAAQFMLTKEIIKVIIKESCTDIPLEFVPILQEARGERQKVKKESK